MTADTARQRQALGRERAALRKAVLYSDLSAGAVMMALAYESFAGNGLDRVWVSDEVLARLTRQSSVNTRKKHRAELVAAGVLVMVEPGNSRGTSPVYALRYRQLLTLGTARDAQDASEGTSTFDAVPSNFDEGTVNNWPPNSKWNSERKEPAPSVPDAASGAVNECDHIADLEFEIERAGYEWDAERAASEMLDRGEHPAFVVATLAKRNDEMGLANPWVLQ